MSFIKNFDNNLLTLEDQDEALTDSWWSYMFALKNIPGSDFKALQAKACEKYGYAVLFALNVLNADIKYCQKHACKDPHFAYRFALDIVGADINYCQEYACKHPYWAYCFARDVPGANIQYCQKSSYKDFKIALKFLQNINNSDLEDFRHFIKIHFMNKIDYYNSEINKIIMNKYVNNLEYNSL